MSRDVPFRDYLVCDVCHRLGAYDFMGDYYCEDCLKDSDVEDNDFIIL